MLTDWDSSTVRWVNWNWRICLFFTGELLRTRMKGQRRKSCWNYSRTSAHPISTYLKLRFSFLWRQSTRLKTKNLALKYVKNFKLIWPITAVSFDPWVGGFEAFVQIWDGTSGKISSKSSLTATALYYVEVRALGQSDRYVPPGQSGRVSVRQA